MRHAQPPVDVTPERWRRQPRCHDERVVGDDARFLRTATAANRAAVSAMLPTIDGESGSETNRTARRSRRSSTPISTGSSIAPSTIPITSASATPSRSRRRSPTRMSARSPRSAATRTASTSTTSSPPIPASASASSTEHSSPGSSAPPSLGSPDSPSTSPQDLEFSGPVGVGDRVSARVEIVEDLGNEQYRLETVVRDEDDDATVIDGEAVTDRRPTRRITFSVGPKPAFFACIAVRRGETVVETRFSTVCYNAYTMSSISARIPDEDEAALEEVSGCSAKTKSTVIRKALPRRAVESPRPTRRPAVPIR